MENSTKYSTRSRFIAIKQKKNQDVGTVPDRTRARSVVHSARTHFFSAVRQYVSFLFFSGDQVSESFREVGLVRHGQIND